MLKYNAFVKWLNESITDDSVYDDIIEFIKKISEKPVKQDGKRSQKFYIYLKDRENDSQVIIKKLIELGVNPREVYTSDSKFPQTEFVISGVNIRFIYKPVGGTATTTINSTITELTPCILYSYGYKGTYNSKQIMEFLRSQKDLSLCVLKGDQAKAFSDIELFEDSALFEDKMINAWAIYRWLSAENQKSKINEVWWAYRAKPAGVPSNSRADIVIFGDIDYGVSLKAGSTKSAKFRKFSTTFYELCSVLNDNTLDKTKSEVFNMFISPFLTEFVNTHKEYERDIKRINDRNYTVYGKSTPQSKLLDEIYRIADKEDSNKITNIYYQIQLYLKSKVVNIIKTKPDSWKELMYMKLGLETVFPVRTLVALKDQAHEEIADTEDNMKSLIDETRNFEPKEDSKSNKRFTIVMGDGETKKLHDFDIWSSEGGVRIDNPLKFRIAMIG
jgi:hypothetical protein